MVNEKILVVVDVQRDFFDPSGSLYVPESEVLPSKIAKLAPDYDSVIFTLDWHPGNHCSFKSQGGLWPSHCVAYTQGAGLPDEFSEIIGSAELFFKGTDPEREQYGAFEDINKNNKIYSLLSESKSIDICGIAGDYCVKETTRNILKMFSREKVGILCDYTRSIDGGESLEAFIRENSLIRR